MMKCLNIYIALVILFAACRKKDKEIKPSNDCLTPTEVAIAAVSNDAVTFALVGTDSLSVGKVQWTIISPDKTLQIETNGKNLITQSFSKSGEYRITAIVETVCKTRITLTRSETIQVGYFNKVWIKEIGQYTDTTFRAITESRGGGCIVVGFRYIVSLDESGKIIWKNETGVGNGYLNSVVQANDGGYVIGADRIDYTYGLAKISAKGEKLWEKNFTGGGNAGGTGYDRLTTVVNTQDGGYIIGGSSSSLAGIDKSEPPKNNMAYRNYTLTDYWIIKVNSQGVKEWDKTLGGDAEESLSNIVNTTDGGYILSGSSASSKSGDKSDDTNSYYDFWIVKIDRHGVKEWDRSFISGGSMVALPDGSVVLITGSATTTNKINYMKLSNRGEILWQKQVQGDRARIISSNDGGFAMIGRLDQYNLISFSSDGEIQDVRKIDLEGADLSYGLVLGEASSGGFYGLVSWREQQAVVYIKK
ncbi:hypothetical protein [Dyadobacter sp. CY323]|uniref:hypothetical protein n=1 Tax=Dyadobacter sp. CY323 TaxID=2907302 RepID=UPI001F3D4F30|nr:hypothetical protein [Dyadobacter sp. CY323]MCE6988138.1 hypothetical protein [Dyadobacter sp. CY323]